MIFAPPARTEINPPGLDGNVWTPAIALDDALLKSSLAEESIFRVCAPNSSLSSATLPPDPNIPNPFCVAKNIALFQEIHL